MGLHLKNLRFDSPTVKVQRISSTLHIGTPRYARVCNSSEGPQTARLADFARDVVAEYKITKRGKINQVLFSEPSDFRPRETSIPAELKRVAHCARLAD